MIRLPLHRAFWTVCVVVIGVAGVVAGQVRSTPPAASPLDELLVEVRALRAEINQAAGASIRAQLLVARLQLQEQRIAAVSRQLADVQRRLSDLASARAPLAVQVKRFEEAHDREPLEKQQELEHMLKVLKSQLEQLQKTEQELRGQEASLAAQMASEQSWWAEFNTRLEELERALPGPPR